MPVPVPVNPKDDFQLGWKLVCNGNTDRGDWTNRIRLSLSRLREESRRRSRRYHTIATTDATAMMTEIAITARLSPVLPELDLDPDPDPDPEIELGGDDALDEVFGIWA